MSRDDLERATPTPELGDLFDRFRERQAERSSPEQIDSVENTATGSMPAGQESFVPTSTDGQLDPATKTPPDFPATNQGSLPPEARRALVGLLRQGVVLASQKANVFDVICRYQDAVRGHLADLYLKLVLDQRTGVAFVAALDEEDGEQDEEAVSLISRRTLTLYDTLLLLILRKHFQERETAGEQRIVIDIEKIEANLTPFLPLTNSSRADRRKLDSALKKMAEKHILGPVRGSDDRFEITPIIRYVVNAGFLESMLEEYKRLAFDAGLTTTALPDAAELNAGDDYAG